MIVTRALAAALAAALLLAGWQTYRLANERTAHAETRSAHALQMQMMFEAARLAGEQARTEEQRRTAEVQKAADEAYQAMERARADAAAAADAGGRLRQHIATLTATCRRAPGNTATASAGAPTDTTADLLADVQRRLDEASEQLAGFADSAHTAGRTCQQSYDALNR